MAEAVAAALEAASAIVLGPVSKDPWLVIMFACFAGTITTTAVLFYLAFRGFDADYVTSDVVATDGNMDQGQNDDPEAGAPARETGESDSHCEEKAIRIKTAEVPL
ncbi:hypothetical protein OCU04_000155 [Sclerotinia nivalis]|uniref:Uncharacterized protein n=1 Tax=Sclerotinia nivalis TaxID=352851 RepID=A0A9X0AVH5_9HELO|nr:hypothetical protein OCU04_000155 [Sclerotinia nivalis]